MTKPGISQCPHSPDRLGYLCQRPPYAPLQRTQNPFDKLKDAGATTKSQTLEMEAYESSPNPVALDHKITTVQSELTALTERRTVKLIAGIEAQVEDLNTATGIKLPSASQPALSNPSLPSRGGFRIASAARAGNDTSRRCRACLGVFLRRMPWRRVDTVS